MGIESFLFSGGSLLLSFLGGFVLGFLGILLFLVYCLFISLLFGNLVFLSFLDLSNSLLGECLLVFSFGILQLVDGVESDALNGSLLFSLVVSLSLSFAGLGLFNFLMQSPPCGGPSESLGFDFSASRAKYLRPKLRFRLDRNKKGLPSLATNLTPLPG